MREKWKYWGRWTPQHLDPRINGIECYAWDRQDKEQQAYLHPVNTFWPLVPEPLPREQTPTHPQSHQ
jgi:hypothetical protein